MVLTEWRVLIDQNRKYYSGLFFSHYMVKDFAIHGQLFSAIVANGKKSDDVTLKSFFFSTTIDITVEPRTLCSVFYLQTI